MVDTITKTQVSEEEQKDNARFAELNSKSAEELTDAEKTEIGELKERHNTRWQKRVDQLTWRAKEAEENFGKASKEAEELRERLDALEAQKNQEPIKIVETTVEIGGKKYYTDDALVSMVKAGELSDSDAYRLQRQRDKAELKNELLSEIETEKKQDEDKRVRADDQQKVLKQYPHFNKNHPDFNPNDPLYQEVNRLWNNGYANNPKGLSLAIEDAKKILRITDKTPDVSDDLGVSSPSAPGRGKKEDEVVLSKEEEETAVRLYTMGAGAINPKTGRTYTPDEAIKKALDAKKKRLTSRRIL